MVLISIPKLFQTTKFVEIDYLIPVIDNLMNFKLLNVILKVKMPKFIGMDRIIWHGFLVGCIRLKQILISKQ